MKNTIAAMIIAISGSAISLSSFADESSTHTDTDLPVISGEVRKVKPKSGKITIRHEEIPNLDMPGMTMVFRADDDTDISCLLYTSPSPRDLSTSRMPSSA